MSQNPPEAIAAYPVEPQRTLSVPALLSMICGLVLCIPFITSLAAVILGIIGLRRTHPGGQTGRGFAVAGLILGIVGLIGWALISGGVVMFINASAVPREVGRQFAMDLSAGNIDAAMALSHPQMPQGDLEEAYEQLQPIGPIQHVAFHNLHAQTTAAGTEWTLRGTATFPGQTMAYEVVLLRIGPGDYRVVRFRFF